MSNIFTDFLDANKTTLIKDGDKTIIACDVVTDETHSMVAEATQYEIEDGSIISDHIINRGRVLSIEGIVTDDPIVILSLKEPGRILERTIASITPSFISSKLSYGLSGEDGKPSKEAFDQFEQIYNNKIPVIIVTGLKKYENMIMENLDIRRTSKTVRSLNFSATFRQLILVNAAFVNAPETYQEPELGAQPKKNAGKLNSRSLPPNTNSSLFYDVLSTGASWLGF